MKVLTKVLVSSVCAFLSVGVAEPLSAQTWSQYIALQGSVFELEMKLQDQQKYTQDLARRQNALSEAYKNAKFDIDFLRSMRDFADTKTDDTSKKLNTAESKLRETEDRLTKAEEIIGMQNLRLSALEARANKPKTPTAPASKLKAPVSKPPSGFTPDTPDTSPHPASNKFDASKPKAPLNKPTPGKPTAQAPAIWKTVEPNDWKTVPRQ